jgi:hypothetical protein
MSNPRDGAAIVGVGAAACAACCAGPILGFLAAIGLGTAAGAVLFGIVGLVIALLVGGGLLIRRRRRAASRSCATAPVTVAVVAPTIRTGT